MITPNFSNFYSLSIDERRARLPVLIDAHLKLEQADDMVENLVGVMSLPLGVACHFVVDDKAVWIPMAIEEPSVIAAASHMAKLASLMGGFRSEVDEPVMMGQIQLLGATDWERVAGLIEANQSELVANANKLAGSLPARGGGCLGIRLKPLNGSMGVVEVRVDCRDAMGANVINTIMEGLAPEIETLTHARAGFKILSNLSDERLARSSCDIPYKALANDAARDNGRQIAERVVLGYEFARLDPYRACTHNKGVMNGIDAVVIATGNDWRAVEAGAHAYASVQSGGYGPLTHYELDDVKQVLKARIELPMAIGVVGGVTKAHPTVQACLELLGEFGKSAKQLSGLIASVGLAQNIAAMRALAAEGIQAGHMALHHRKQV
jgi:hydroxymethylglutaryl-CoA reductase